MRYILVALSLCLHFCSSAQLNGKYNFRHIDQEDGLLHSAVIGISQDERGYMWILTYNGLQRYDGIRFVNYQDIVKNSTLNIINSSKLFVDTLLHQVEVIYTNRMDRLTLADNLIKSVSLSDLYQENLVKPMEFPIGSKEKWLISPAGTTMLTKDSSTLLRSFININPGSAHKISYTIIDSISGLMYGTLYTDFYVANIKNHTLELSSDDHPKHPLLKLLKENYGGHQSNRYIMMDSERNIWIVSWKDYLIRYDPADDQVYTYDLKKGNMEQDQSVFQNPTLLVNAIFEDRQHHIWIGTEYAGLLLFDREKNNFQFLTSDDKIKNGLTYNYGIFSIFQDVHDNIWVGTDRGISIFNPYRDQFQSIRHLDGEAASLPKHDINEMIETPQREILVGTWGGGITIFDPQWNFLRNVMFEGPVETNMVWSFIQNDDGHIWAGTQGGYIHVYDPAGHTFTRIRPQETYFSTIRVMAKDHDGNILLGLHNGKVSTWNKQEKKFYSYHEAIDSTGEIYSPVINILVDHFNRCWITNEVGLFEFDLNKRVYSGRYVFHGGSGTQGMTTQGLEEFNDSLLLVGVLYGGLQFFNKRTHEFFPATAEKELTTTSVYAIKKDTADNIWFTTDFKLHRYNPDFTQHTVYSIDRSIADGSFDASKWYVFADGQWATATRAEIISFHPADLESKQEKDFRVEISGFKVAGQDWYMDSCLAMHKAVVLNYTDNFFSIDFASLDFTNLRQTHYDYKLTGVDKDWIQSFTQPYANYTDVKPGNYTFEVRAERGNGYSAITSFTIIIKPPWWQTNWFRISSLCCIGLLVIAGVRKRIQTIRKDSELKHRIAETEMMALRSQMNPHFIFNCLNSIDNLIQTDQKEKATTYLSKFALLIRAILENSKNNVIPCWKDLEALQLYLAMEALRWDNKIQYQLNIDPQVQMGDYKVPPMIIQPFVENAIHHGLLNKMGTDKKMEINVSLENDQIKYTILDNGVGRIQAAEYKKLNRSSLTSFGMQISQDRISLFNQHENQSIKITDLYDDQQRPAGTQVEVWLTTQPMTI